ncbi:MAG: aminotransferase class I/II-fold pyridoxal phosphate-dependent enzyme [Enterocloster clostridioformis]
MDEMLLRFPGCLGIIFVIPGLARFKHLFVLKAFTKLYAMAGLRLGYGLCSDEGLLERLQAVRQPWSVSGAGPARRRGGPWRDGFCGAHERGD